MNDNKLNKYRLGALPLKLETCTSLSSKAVASQEGVNFVSSRGVQSKII